jgi:hypothetical protein
VSQSPKVASSSRRMRDLGFLAALEMTNRGRRSFFLIVLNVLDGLNKLNVLNPNHGKLTFDRRGVVLFFACKEIPSVVSQKFLDNRISTP